MRHIYTSLDIGSNTIKIVVCELYQNKLNLLCNVSSKSRGIKKGLITNYDLAYKSVSDAFDKVEELLGIKIKKVITSIPSFNAEYSVIKGAIKIENDDDIITSKDVIKCLEVAVKNYPYTLREMVTIIPIDYTVDDEAFIKDPKGLKCENFGCRAVLVTTPKKNVYSVIKPTVINNVEFMNNLEQYDLLLSEIDNKDNLISVNDVIISQYEEIVLGK